MLFKLASANVKEDGQNSPDAITKTRGIKCNGCQNAGNENAGIKNGNAVVNANAS